MGYIITKATLRHRSGTKEYHFLTVTNDLSQKALVTYRWGKAGAWGQMDTKVGNALEVILEARKKWEEKESRGYSVLKQPPEVRVNTVEETIKAIGPQYWAQLGADNIKQVMPDADTSGVREAKPAKWKQEKDGKWTTDDTPRHTPPLPEPTKEEIIEENKQNPNWGMF